MASKLGTVGDVIDAVGDTASDVTSTFKDFQRTGRQVENAFGMGKQSSKQASSASQQADSQQTAPQGTSVLDSQVQMVNGKKYYTVPAPTGTRLIIPKEISRTGQERYIGAHALESIMNLMDGNEKCGNIVVLDETQKPSALYYSSDAEGIIYLKGTNKEVKIYDGTTSTPSVPLSEKEFESIAKALRTKTNENDIAYFKTIQERGDAEDSSAESGSWFSRNWWKILLGLVVAGGIAWGGIAIYNNRQEKKEEKKLQQAIQNAQTNENSNTNATANQASVASANTGLTGTNITNEQVSTQTNLTNQGNSL